MHVIFPADDTTVGGYPILYNDTARVPFQIRWANFLIKGRVGYLIRAWPIWIRWQSVQHGAYTSGERKLTERNG